MTLFLYHLPQLVEAGMIYTAMSPLYKIVNRQGTKYYYTEGEAKNKTGAVSRYKGLGEISPDELQLTVLNPDQRKLIQLKPNNMEGAVELYNTLMGKSSEARRNFILTHKINKIDSDDVYDDDDGGAE